MKLSRKRKRELRKLRSNAEGLWQEQQAVLEHASTLLRQARKQATLLNQEQVVPRVLSTYETRLKPSVDRGLLVGRTAATGARAKVVGEVLPALTGVAASALSVLQMSKALSSRFDSEALQNKLKTFSASLAKAPEPPKKTGPGAGTFALVGIGAVALAGIGYAAWQTFRADDDLWIADDEPEATGTTNPADVPPTDVPPTVAD
ncbi:hypothetical protein [Naasia sp. SYSU D00948]|uniref:hypothetical protein n=1 Tax=Naasia sp. SYSU D00948 TaxID=2817379 RepID=UPI001B305B05|nr:hypothetical protein [Naasia sp. SYSU D00948]